MTQRLKKLYLETIFPSLVQSFPKKTEKAPHELTESNPRELSKSEDQAFSKKQTAALNVHEIPKVLKIVINRGLGEAALNSKLVDVSLEEMVLISGQKTVVKKAKKSVAGFKVREGMPVGISVTLRGDRMYAFLDRLINLALPRIRDFQGLKTQGFDGRGNFTMGLKEQLMFPEIVYEKVDKARGMDISIVTSAKTDEEGYALLKAFGMPFNTDSLKKGK